MAAVGSIKGRDRFTAACSALSRYVKAAERAPAVLEARPAPAVALPLMPGADVSAAAHEDHEAGPTPAPTLARLTIFYGTRVVVLDDVPADRAAELLRLAACAAAKGTRGRGQVVPAAEDDLPMARKASLRRFMEKRKGRAAARGPPYRRPGGAGDTCPDRLTLAL
ncbi:protein TIFY 11e-like [Phragmites australis]|uniref:protein TIFY 11e-like n=1 Tax=Phragmites australis TaxID=29695 RepID=UPI002D772008|nr:protein TIFY 11e-like [Phragmites australis]